MALSESASAHRRRGRTVRCRRHRLPDVDDFARRFPALVRRGLRARYQLIGYEGLSDAEFWGYWAAHVQDVRFAERRSTAMPAIRSRSREGLFVLTSNVDAMSCATDSIRHGCARFRVTTRICSASAHARRRCGRTRRSSGSFRDRSESQE